MGNIHILEREMKQKTISKKIMSALVPITLLTLMPNITNGQTTFPSGSTITTEGEVYAPGELSPNQEIEAQNIIDSGEDSGVVGTNVFVEVEEEIVVVPLNEISGKETEEVVEIFKARVMEVLLEKFTNIPEAATSGIQQAIENQQNNINKAAEKAAEKVEKAAEKAAKAAEKAAKKAAKAAEKAAKKAAKAAEKAAKKADKEAEKAAKKEAKK